MIIKKITPYQILDSRGEPTLLVTMTADNGMSADFSVPTGASKGVDEVVEKRDGEGPYGGKGVLTCIDLINTTIAPKFIGYPLDQLADFDGLLVALDGSEHKENF
nr:phosphopyruvate hydratase [Candidatus Saccharibacteria bacterium]